MAEIIDISASLPDCRVYPGDPVPCLKKVLFADKDGCNLTELSMCTHNGTHVDAPLHFIDGAAGADEIPLDKCIGECVVTENDDAEKAAETCTRIIIKNGDITARQAEHIAGRVDLIGTDGLSFGARTDEQEAVHKILLSAGVVLLEGLVLDNVKCGRYKLIALPLKLKGSDGSPVRAVLLNE